MARDFNGSTDYLYNASSPITAMPLTLACWVCPDSLTVDGYPIGIYNSGANGFYGINIGGAQTGDPVQAHHQTDTGGNARASTSTGYSTGVWQHVAAVFASSTSRAAYLNGTNKGTNTTSTGTTTVSRISVGARYLSSVSQYFDGKVAMPCWWNVALSDDEIAQLATGVHPYTVRPDAIVAFVRIDGSSPEPDEWGGYSMTVGGTPASYEDPPINYPTLGGIIVPAAVAPTVGKPALFHAHYMSQGMRP